MDELEKYYQYLKGAKADVPPTFDSFKSTLSDEKSAKQYYQYLRDNQFDTPDTYDIFSNTFGLKKNESLPSKPSATPLQSHAKETDNRFSFDKVLNPNKQEGNAPLPQPVTQKVAPKKSEKYLEADWMTAADPKSLKEKSASVDPIISATTGFASVVSSSLKSIAIAAKRYDFFNEYTDKKTEDLVTYKAGKWVDETVKDLVGEATPEQQELLSTKLFTAVGQMGGFMLGGIGGKVMKMSPALTTAALGAAVGGASEYEAAVESGATEDQAAKAFWINAALNTTEGLPFMSMFRKMDKYTGGLATGLLAKKLSSTVGGRLTNELAGGIAGEVAQEVGVQALSNVTAANTYDATRKWYDGLVETGGISAIIGGSMSGVAVAIRNKRAQGGLTKQEDAQLEAAEQFAQEKADEALDPNKESVSTPTAKSEKVKAIVKSKTDLEADLAHNTTLPEDTKSAMQSEVEVLDQNLEAAKEEVYQKELDIKEAETIQADIDKNSELIKDETLSESTKALIQKQIQEDTERLQSLNVNPNDTSLEQATKPTEQVANPLQQEVKVPEVQNDKEALPNSTNEVGQGEPTSATAVLEPKVVEPSTVKSEEVIDNPALRNDGLANAPTSANVTERTNQKHPFIQKISDALIKLGILKGDDKVIGGQVQGGSKNEGGGFTTRLSDINSENKVGDNVGELRFNDDGSIRVITKDGTIHFDKNGNVISHDIVLGSSDAKDLYNKLEGSKQSIIGLEKIRDSDDFKYKTVEETDGLGNRKKVKRLKTNSELSESTKKINDTINKAKEELKKTQTEYDALPEHLKPKSESLLSKEQTQKSENKPIQSGEAKAELPNTEKKADTTNEEANTIEPAAEKVTGEGSGGGKEPPVVETVNEKPKEEPLNDKGILNRLYKADKTPDAAKKGFEEKGLKYQTKNQEEAEGVAKAVIDEVGIDDAILYADAQKFDGDVNSLIYAESLNRLAELESKAATPEEALLYATQYKDISIKYDEAARKGGRFNSAINYFYKKSPLGIKLKEAAEKKKIIKEFTEQVFSPEQLKQKEEIENLVQADTETIQKQYEEQFNETIGGLTEADIEAKVKEGVESEIAKIYEALPKEKKTAVGKAISALDKIHAKLKNKAYSDVTGVTALVDAGVVTIRAALKAGVSAAKAVELGIAEIKKAYENKYGKKWEKEDEFRKDYLGGLQEQGVIDAQQKRQAAKEYKMLETERNRQLQRVGDLTEKLKSLQAGIHPETGTKTTKLDVPEIEALKAKVKEEVKRLNAIDAQQKRVVDLEAELERLQNRFPKEKRDSVAREKSPKEIEIETKIEAEKETIRKENKANNELRLSDAKEAVRQRIEKIKAEIIAKERTLTEEGKKLNEDLELARLKEIEKSITELRDKYLPEEKDRYESEKQREKVKDKLVNDIIDLNEQINARKRTPKTEKTDYSNDAEISKLTKIKEAKKAILNEIDPLAVPKEKATAERVATAEENLQTKIDGIREEIINKEREVKKSKSKLESKKLDQLREQKKALETLRDKYLPKGKDPYANEKAAKAVEDKLIKENIELNRQIAKGEKDIAKNKQSVESENIDKLKAERDGRKEILEAIDPTPKQYVQNALIEQGFGKTIKVKTKNGTEERQVLDWTKLAGAEGSVTKISENVGKALEKSGFTPNQLERMKDAFIEEYTNLRRDVIQKGQNVIAQRNKTTVTADQKSAAKKLAEMYNYGLFDKDLAGYEIALAKVIGIDKLGIDNLKNVIELGKASAELFATKFQGRTLTERELTPAIQRIDDLMRYELSQEVKLHGTNKIKLAGLVRTYMDLVNRMGLVSIMQTIQNPLSGKMEAFYASMGYGTTKGLKKESVKIARGIYKEMVMEKGVGFGNVESQFINKGSLELEIDRMSDRKIVQAVMSTAIGKTMLDAVDSAYKSRITQQKFTHTLVNMLMNDRLINGKIEKGMSREDAKNYVAEKLTGQSLEDAKTTAKEIIDKINKSAGKKLFNDSPLFVDRLANDIVNAALVNGEKITIEMVDAAYGASYKAAGRGLGHVANNQVSRMIAAEAGKKEAEVKQALKEKEYDKAAMLIYESTFSRNVLNPYVGGGTNWIFLKAEKTGLGLISGLYSMQKRGGKIDLTTKEGIAQSEKLMYENMLIRDKLIRGAAGAIATGLSLMLINTDEYDKWATNNPTLSKYTSLFMAEALLLKAALNKGKTKRYIESFFNQNPAFDKPAKVFNALAAVFDGDKKASVKIGSVVGSAFGAPAPWRLIRDGQQIIQELSGETAYKISRVPSETMIQEMVKGGMMEYAGANKLLGLEPKQPFSKDVSDFIDKKKIEIRNPNKDKEMTDEQYEKFLTRRNEIAEIYITQVKENGLINRKTDDASVQEVVKNLISMANEQAKLETYQKKPVEKEPETFVKGFKPVPFKVNK